MTGFSRAASIGRNCRFLQAEASDPAQVNRRRRRRREARPLPPRCARLLLPGATPAPPSRTAAARLPPRIAQHS
eukprot:3511671-Prymnesium_polylepis.1